MKKILIACLALTLTTSIFAAEVVKKQKSNVTTTSAQTPSIPLSFVQVTKSARITAVDGEPNTYKLTLYNIPPYMTYITSRPARSTGFASNENFVKAWTVGADSFKKNNPNAVIYAGIINQVANKGNRFYTVQVANPIYNANKNEMSYDVRPIGNQKFLLGDIELNYVTVIIN